MAHSFGSYAIKNVILWLNESKVEIELKLNAVMGSIHRCILSFGKLLSRPPMGHVNFECQNYVHFYLVRLPLSANVRNNGMANHYSKVRSTVQQLAKI